MLTTKPLRILVADLQPIICEGIAAVLSQQADLSIAGLVYGGQDAIDRFAALRPDALVMERYFADMDGLQVIAAIRQSFPSAHILILSEHAGEACVYTAFQAGARGYFMKDTTGEALAEGVRKLCAGRTVLCEMTAHRLAQAAARENLTSRETELLQFIAEGKSNQEIASALFITEGTVKSHINAILRKLGVESRTQAALVALQRGLADTH